MFLQQLCSGAVSCYNTIEGLKGCSEYKRWSEKHPVVVARHLIEKANGSYQSVYIPLTCNINVYGRSVQINGSIKSIDPPCSADMFGFASETTAPKHGKEVRLDVGINLKVIDNAAQHYRGFPVNKASDEARRLRYLQPRLTNSGEVVTLGKMWNPDVQN
ncbi:hypothetical protein ACROYT_G015064 [Oculina patagonica]